MFQEFFTRAVTAGLISESQKDNLLDFAKKQPITSFVASRPPVVPEGLEDPQPMLSTAQPAPPPAEPLPSRVGVVLESLILSLVMLAIGAWAAGYDAGPIGRSLRSSLQLLPVKGSLSSDIGPVTAPAQPTTIQVD